MDTNIEVKIPSSHKLTILYYINIDVAIKRNFGLRFIFIFKYKCLTISFINVLNTKLYWEEIAYWYFIKIYGSVHSCQFKFKGILHATFLTEIIQ